MKQEFTSKNTSINKIRLPRIFNLVKQNKGWHRDSRNLDIGGGKFDNFSEKLKEEFNITNLILDPFNRTEEHNKAIEKAIEKNQVDTVTLSNVLCIIKEESIRMSVIRNTFLALKEDGVLFVTNYEGDKSGIGRQTGKDQYQMNEKAIFYIDEIKKVFPTVKRKGSLLIAEKRIEYNTIVL